MTAQQLADGWIDLATTAGTLIGVVYVAFKARLAASRSEKAAELSKPTGNGFAGKTLSGLEEIKETVKAVQECQSALRTGQAELKIGQADTAARLLRVEDAAARHLELHVSQNGTRIPQPREAPDGQ